MFGILDTVSEMVEDTLNLGASVITLGAYGDVDRDTLQRLVANGVSIAMLAEETGVAVDVLEEFLED